MGFVLLILGIGMIVGARGFEGALILEVGPDFFPTIIASLIAGLSVILIITNAIKLRSAALANAAKAEPNDNSGKSILSAGALRVLAALALLTGYVFLIVPVGFLISSSVYMLIMMCFLAEKLTLRKVFIYVFISILVAVLSSFIFVRFFWLMLPRGILGF